jgi:hypothetical protein
MVVYYNGFFFQNIGFNSTFNYPTTTYGGPLTGENYEPYGDGGVSFSSEASGGPIYNYTYDDFSRLTSVVNIGNFFCLPTLVFSFSSYDESVSPINKIAYSFKDEHYTILPSLSETTSTTFPILTGPPVIIKLNRLISPKLKTFTLSPEPGKNFVTTETLYLSVFKLDNTINKFIINFDLYQCGVLDVYSSTNIINSQILDDANLVLLTMEDGATKRVMNSIIRTDIPFYLLTGGDVVSLGAEEEGPRVVFEFESTPTDEIFLAEQIRQQALPEIPIPPPKINPIVPDIAEYYYRGEKGIRIRPLIVTLLPRQEFFYQKPESGLTILSGGAPYAPGSGIKFNVEFRGI